MIERRKIKDTPLVARAIRELDCGHMRKDYEQMIIHSSVLVERPVETADARMQFIILENGNTCGLEHIYSALSNDTFFYVYHGNHTIIDDPAYSFLQISHTLNAHPIPTMQELLSNK